MNGPNGPVGLDPPDLVLLTRARLKEDVEASVHVLLARIRQALVTGLARNLDRFLQVKRFGRRLDDNDDDRDGCLRRSVPGVLLGLEALDPDDRTVSPAVLQHRRMDGAGFRAGAVHLASP